VDLNGEKRRKLDVSLVRRQVGQLASQPAGERGSLSFLFSYEEKIEVEEREASNAQRTSPFNLIFSSSVYGTYHFASRVLPLRERRACVSEFLVLLIE
jgi:hypothetical protein